MDLLSVLRTLGGLGVVLGILAGALWIVRRYDLRLPGQGVSGKDNRLELLEKLPLDARRVVALVRKDGHEHLILIAPEGHLILESGLVRSKFDPKPKPKAAPRDSVAQPKPVRPRAPATASTSSANFADIIDDVRTRVRPKAAALKTLLDRVPVAKPPRIAPTPCTRGAPIRVLKTSSVERFDA